MKKISLLIFVFVFTYSVNTFSQTYDFELNDVEGNTVKLSSQIGKGPILIQFWALWCVPCKEEMNNNNKIYNKLKDRGFIYLAINEDQTKSSAKVKSYVESKEFKFSVLMDSDGKVFETFGGQSLPFALLMNNNGEIMKTYTGFLPGDEIKLEEEITAMLNPK